MGSKKIDRLYMLVTSAIFAAERLEDAGSPQIGDAYRRVSKIEEDIARLLPPSDEEGALARRGAIRAARKAGDLDRARKLFRRYAGERVTPKAVKELRKLLGSD